MQHKETELTPKRVKAGPDDGLAEGEFLVYPSTFTREPDSYGDVVARGAFLDSIKAHAEAGSVLPGLFGHRMDDPDFYVAWATEMGEDEHGFWVKGVFDMEHAKARQVYKLVKGRRLNQLSFGYDVLDQSPVALPDGRKANELRRVHIHEFSFVPIGANRDTSVAWVKSQMTDAEAGTAEATDHDDAARVDETAKAAAPDEEPTEAKSCPPAEEQVKSAPVGVMAALLEIYARKSGQKEAHRG